MRFVRLTVLIVGLCVSPTIARADQITVTVKGMVCSFCAQGIKRIFERKESVESVAVDLDKKIVTIKTKKDASLSDTEVSESIVDSGFEVVEIARKQDA